jgi:hypothetical protein
MSPWAFVLKRINPIICIRFSDVFIQRPRAPLCPHDCWQETAFRPRLRNSRAPLPQGALKTPVHVQTLTRSDARGGVPE